MKFSRELIKGSIKSLILAVLADEGEMHGYQLVKAIRAKSNESLAFGEGSVYPALHAMEREGVVRSRWEETSGGRKRKYYVITKKGRRILATSVQEWNAFFRAFRSVVKHLSISL